MTELETDFVHDEPPPEVEGTERSIRLSCKGPTFETAAAVDRGELVLRLPKPANDEEKEALFFELAVQVVGGGDTVEVDQNDHLDVPLPPLSFLVAQVLDDEDEPLADEPTKLILSDGRELTVNTDEDGFVRHNPVPAGFSLFSLGELSGATAKEPERPMIDATADEPHEVLYRAGKDTELELRAGLQYLVRVNDPPPVYMKVLAESVAVLDGPDPGANETAQLAQGTIVRVLEERSSADSCAVRFHDVSLSGVEKEAYFQKDPREEQERWVQLPLQNVLAMDYVDISGQNFEKILKNVYKFDKAELKIRNTLFELNQASGKTCYEDKCSPPNGAGMKAGGAGGAIDVLESLKAFGIPVEVTLDDVTASLSTSTHRDDNQKSELVFRNIEKLTVKGGTVSKRPQTKFDYSLIDVRNEDTAGSAAFKASDSAGRVHRS